MGPPDLPKKAPSPKRKKITFIHPDLGIGGAERLVIDAALGLQSLGHTVVIFTSHCDPTHCFDEARNGTLDVRVRGNTIFPATIFGRFKILLTILRQIHLLLAITSLFTPSSESAQLLGGPPDPDVFFVDQLSACLPLIRYLFPNARILFYCHFPDLLLVQGRGKWWKRLWRVGFDWMEGWGMTAADRVVVNSRFTRGIVQGIWGWLLKQEGRKEEEGVGIVYPCVHVEEGELEKGEGAEGEKVLWKEKKVVLSINRFERKKGIELALRAFARIGEREKKGSRLVIAGGYDPRVSENVAYHQELEALADSLELHHATAKNMITAQATPNSISVLFLLSVPAQLKSILLQTAKLLVYTPSNEHFGIVPLEAMLAGVPVLAANSGGPLETVVERETGWLRDVDDVQAWSDIMGAVLAGMISEGELDMIAENGRRRVRREFSQDRMATRLETEIEMMMQGRRRTMIGGTSLMQIIGGISLIVVFVAVFIWHSLKSQTT